MLQDLLIFILSLAALAYSADLFIDSVVILAKRLNVSSMVIGLTVVGIGTSLPELMASGTAAFEGYPDIAVGNVLGSNICNIGLVLGLPALFGPIVCRRAVVNREGVLMALLTLGLWALGACCGVLSREWGVLFVGGFVGFLIWVVRNGHEADSIVEDIVEDSLGVEVEPKEQCGSGVLASVLLAVFKTIGCMFVLVLSSKLLVDSTVSLAQAFAVSEHVIALSMIAFGTSLPELSVSIAAVRKGEGDILVGNIIGSNVSNILLILGTCSLIEPFTFNAIALRLDFPIANAFALLMMFFLARKRGIQKPEGVLFLVLYAAFVWRCIVI